VRKSISHHPALAARWARNNVSSLRRISWSKRNRSIAIAA
jgi:hypothetical protein